MMNPFSHSNPQHGLPPEVRYWKQFQQALIAQADKGDLDGLRNINRKLVNALIKRGAPKSHAELAAREELAQCHQAIIHRLQQDKAQLAQTMKSFRANQDGLAAYELTAISSGTSVAMSGTPANLNGSPSPYGN